MAKSCLRNEIITVRMVEEHHAMNIPKGKNGYLKYDGSFTIYDAPVTLNNTVFEVLTSEEREFLEEFIDSTRPKGWMSPHVQSKLNVWKGKSRYKVELTKEGIDLNLNNPIEFIKYKLLIANSGDIAPSYETRLDKRYIYYIENKEVADETKVKAIEVRIKASELFGKISQSEAKLMRVLRVMFKGDTRRVPKGMTSNSAKALLFDAIEKSPTNFISIVEDTEFENKAVLYKALERGVINRNGFDYNLGMGDGRLIGNGINEVLEYIKKLKTDNSKQDEYLKFKAALKD